MRLCGANNSTGPNRAKGLKLVVTGATGRVGQLLVPLLHDHGHELFLVSRNPKKLRSLYPWAKGGLLDDVPSRAREFDGLIHLAAVNNDSAASSEEYQSGNIDYLLAAALCAKKAAIRRFVNLSSTHVLQKSGESLYAASKKAGEERLAAMAGLVSTTIVAPCLYGKRFIGRVAFLNRFPKLSAWVVFPLLSLFRPVLHVEELTNAMLNVLRGDTAVRRVLLADDKQTLWPFAFFKRCLDLSFASAVCLFFSWLFCLVWIAIRIESRGPGFLVQERVGINGSIFRLIKFRTMVVGTKNCATHQVDARAVTRIGRYLRKYKLDELPQIFNIFRNELSLVGPRPCLPSQQDLIDARNALGVSRCKPGITGFAQIQGVDMSNPENLAAVDDVYFKLRTVQMELGIIGKTFLGFGVGDRTRAA